MKAKELREMSDEQLELTATECAETIFRLRIQSQTEKMSTPSLVRKNRRMIARIRTVQGQRTAAKS